MKCDIVSSTPIDIISVSTGLAFVCTTYISTDLRGVDDQKNHALGTIAACGVFASAGNYFTIYNLNTYHRCILKVLPVSNVRL